MNAASRHVVSFTAHGLKAACTCGNWAATVGDDTSDNARRRVIDAAEQHAFTNRGLVEYAGAA